MNRGFRKKVATSQGHNVDRNCHVFHVCQHLSGDFRFFSDNEVADLRFRKLCEACDMYGVTVLHSVTMPNHTHEMFFCNCYEDLALALKSTNQSVSSKIRTMAQQISPDVSVFSSRPRYIPIYNLRQYYSTAFYIFSNPDEESSGGGGFTARHSSFAMMKRGYVPRGFDESIYGDLFGIPLETYLELLDKPVTEYRMAVDRVCRSFPYYKEKEVFFIDWKDC